MINNTKYTKELLQEVVKKAESVADVIRKLGLRESGGNFSHIKKRIVEYGLDISHFISTATGPPLRSFGKSKKSPDDILVLRHKGHRNVAHRLRRALLESGVDYKCADCGIGNNYNNKPLVLEIHHKNDNWLDDRKENLEFKCPNCHSQMHNQTLINTIVDDDGSIKVVQLTKARTNKRKNKCLCCKINLATNRFCSVMCSNKYNKNGGKYKKVPNRPPLNVLLELIKQTNCCAVAKMYGVSDKTVNKWIASDRRKLEAQLN